MDFSLHLEDTRHAQIAKEGKVGKLALIHHFPYYDNKKLEKLLKVASVFYPKTILAQDLKAIEF